MTQPLAETGRTRLDETADSPLACLEAAQLRLTLHQLMEPIRNDGPHDANRAHQLDLAFRESNRLRPENRDEMAAKN